MLFYVDMNTEHSEENNITIHPQLAKISHLQIEFSLSENTLCDVKLV